MKGGNDRCIIHVFREGVATGITGHLIGGCQGECGARLRFKMQLQVVTRRADGDYEVKVRTEWRKMVHSRKKV